MIDWKKCKIGEVADLCLGKMLDEKKNKGEPLPYLANINVRWGEFDLSNLREMRFESHEIERYGLRAGDIVMCEGGEPGRCAIWQDENQKVMIQKALHRIRPHVGVDSSFLFYSFLHKGRVNGFAPLFTGSTIKHLPKQNLELVEIAVPPSKVQRRIASILSAYDDLIANNRRRIQLLEQAAQHLYNEWFVRLRYPGHEHTHVVDGVPKSWEKKTLESVCAEENGIQTGPFGSQLHQSDYTDVGVPVVMPKDIVRFRIETDSIARVSESMAEKLARHRMQLNDIVYGRRGDIGRRAFISTQQTGWLCGSGSMRIRPNPSLINPRYLFETLGTSETAGTIANRAKGSTMLNLNASIMKSVPILIPNRDLQNSYADQVEPISEMIETLIKENQKLVQARDLLLPRLMSGEISV